MPLNVEAMPAHRDFLVAKRGPTGPLSDSNRQVILEGGLTSRSWCSFCTIFGGNQRKTCDYCCPENAEKIAGMKVRRQSCRWVSNHFLDQRQMSYRNVTNCSEHLELLPPSWCAQLSARTQLSPAPPSSVCSVRLRQTRQKRMGQGLHVKFFWDMTSFREAWATLCKLFAVRGKSLEETWRMVMVETWGFRFCISQTRLLEHGLPDHGLIRQPTALFGPNDVLHPTLTTSNGL